MLYCPCGTCSRGAHGDMPLYIHNPCSVCNYDTHLVFCVRASVGIYLSLALRPLAGLSFSVRSAALSLALPPFGRTLALGHFVPASCGCPTVRTLSRSVSSEGFIVLPEGDVFEPSFPLKREGELTSVGQRLFASSRACKTDFRPCLMTRAHIGKPPLDCFSSSATSRPPFSIALDFGQVLPLVDYFGSKVGAYKKPCRVSAEP